MNSMGTSLFIFYFWHIYSLGCCWVINSGVAPLSSRFLCVLCENEYTYVWDYQKKKTSGPSWDLNLCKCNLRLQKLSHNAKIHVGKITMYTLSDPIRIKTSCQVLLFKCSWIIIHQQVSPLLWEQKIWQFVGFEHSSVPRRKDTSPVFCREKDLAQL